MPVSSPPEPPTAIEQPDRRSGAPIVDMRDASVRVRWRRASHALLGLGRYGVVRR